MTPSDGPSRNILGRMQVPWPPRLVALAAAALGLDVSLTLGVVAAGQVAQWWTAGLTTGHLMAGFALGAVLCALLMPDSRRFIVAYASFTSAILVALPAILVGAGGHPANLGVYVAVLIQIAAIWAVVAALLYGGRRWIQDWAERRLKRLETLP